jgi:hypothetical protein
MAKPCIAQRRKGAEKSKTRISAHCRAKTVSIFRLKSFFVLSGEAGHINGFLCATASLRENPVFTAQPNISDLVLKTRFLRAESTGFRFSPE